MGRLAANWQFLLISQLVKGRFFIRPDLALSYGPRISHLLSGNTPPDNHNAQRSLMLSTVDQNGMKRGFFYDDEDEEINEKYKSSYDNVPRGSVAIIPIKGSMIKYGSFCEYGTTELAGFIRDAANHKNIAAIVLDIDSGGGAVDAVAPLVDAIREVKAMGKPIVSSIDMACSAAYWVASETDYLVADNGISAEVGSIGVMMSFYDLREHYEKAGIKLHTIYSSLSGDKNLSFQKALDGDYDLIQEEELDPLAVGFQNAVKKNREGKLDLTATGIINGKTYFAEQAKAVGLIDHIGDSMTAVQIALGKAHAKQLI